MTVLIAGKQRALHSARVLLQVVGIIFVSGWAILIAAQSASAHAELLSTTPEDGAALERPPAEAVLTFNEPVQLLDSSIRLFPGDEAPVVLDAHVSDTEVVAALPGELADGSYALSYRVTSADGHPVSGAITFTIGDADNPTSAPAVDTQTPQGTLLAVRVLTALQYLTLLASAGLVFFDRMVLRSARPRTGRAVRALRWTGIGAAVTSVLLIPVSALNVTGSPLVALLSPSAWSSGVLWAPVGAASLVVLGIAGTLSLSTRDIRNMPGRAFRTTAPLLALVAPVLVGHSQTVEPRTIIILADIGHLLAGSFWTGGVAGLLFFLAGERRRRRRKAPGPDPMLAVQVVERFSRFAIWSVILLALSGTIMGVMIVGSLEVLVTTTYGLTLLLKIGILTPIIAIAGYNRLRLVPTLSTRPTARGQWRLLTRTLTCEAVLLVAVLAVTGFLTNLSPGQDHHSHTAESPAAPVTVSAEAQELAVEGSLEPALTGDNRITFALRYEDEPVTPDEVTLRATLPEHDLGPFEVVPDLDTDTGEYTAQLPLPVAGSWQVQVSARVSTFAEPIVTIPVSIR